MSGALFDLTPKPVAPSPCPAETHEHRWLRFGRAGEREESTLPVDANGEVELTAPNGAVVRLPEAFVAQQLRAAGWIQADPDPVESAWLKRKEWARSRLQEALNRRGR